LTPTISGAVSVANLAFTFVFWLIAWIIFAIAWFYHKNRIPLSLTFKEIPPE
jgi:hypothetical protein